MSKREVPHAKLLCRRSSSHIYLLNDVDVELFGEKTSLGDSLRSTCQTWSKSGSKKGSKRGLLLGVTDSIPIHEYNHYHEYSGSLSIHDMNTLGD